MLSRQARCAAIIRRYIILRWYAHNSTGLIIHIGQYYVVGAKYAGRNAALPGFSSYKRGHIGWTMMIIFSFTIGLRYAYIVAFRIIYIVIRQASQ